MFGGINQISPDLASRKMFIVGSVYKMECFHAYTCFSKIIQGVPKETVQ